MRNFERHYGIYNYEAILTVPWKRYLLFRQFYNWAVEGVKHSWATEGVKQFRETH